MSHLVPPNSAPSERRYRWPWYLLGALILGISVGGWAIFREARRIQRFREEGGLYQPDVHLGPTNGLPAAPNTNTNIPRANSSTNVPQGVVWIRPASYWMGSVPSCAATSMAPDIGPAPG